MKYDQRVRAERAFFGGAIEWARKHPDGLRPWDGAGASGTLLPEWAYRLNQRCSRYNFSIQWVHSGRSVVAVRVSGTGPAVVITHDEEEMREAIGLKPREPPQ